MGALNNVKSVPGRTIFGELNGHELRNQSAEMAKIRSEVHRKESPFPQTDSGRVGAKRTGIYKAICRVFHS